VLGQLQPSLAEARGFPPGEEVYVAEIDLDALTTRMPGGDLRTESLPKFPSIVRDVSILVDEVLPAAAVRGTIRSAAPETLHSIVEFDRYQGKGIPEGRVSLSLRLTFRSPERTLTDDEVEAAMTAIVEFDRYQGKGIPEGRVSLSLRLTFRSPERTLTDDEVEAAMTAIVEKLQRELGAERR
jgi:phenylalanyl-tRNA synthetase beta chain